MLKFLRLNKSSESSHFNVVLSQGESIMPVKRSSAPVQFKMVKNNELFYDRKTGVKGPVAEFLDTAAEVLETDGEPFAADCPEDRDMESFIIALRQRAIVLNRRFRQLGYRISIKRAKFANGDETVKVAKVTYVPGTEEDDEDDE